MSFFCWSVMLVCWSICLFLTIPKSLVQRIHNSTKCAVTNQFIFQCLILFCSHTVQHNQINSQKMQVATMTFTKIQYKFRTKLNNQLLMTYLNLDQECRLYLHLPVSVCVVKKNHGERGTSLEKQRTRTILKTTKIL